MIGPPWYPIPPRGYGGTELVVHLLHGELRRMGHDVRVFGAEHSHSEVEMVADASWSADLGTPWERSRMATYLARVFQRLQGERFDVIHDHSGLEGVLLAIQSRVAPVVVHTVHGELLEPLQTFYRQVEGEARLVAISSSQASTAPDVRFSGVVHNAVEPPSQAPVKKKERYLIEVARITPDKGQHLAIEVARRTGRKLILAGKVEHSGDGERYFEEEIEPYLGRQVEYYPNVQGAEKERLVARAAAGIFPLQWSEPFGLAMVEAMVLGTPVLALASGSAPELIEPGVTGFLSNDVDQMVAAVELLDEIDPERCAAESRERFSPRRMARGYLDIYTDGSPFRSVEAAGESPARRHPERAS
ncbi:MAG TPA: glycosyltransferase family 4 protein [Candidatus Limnocylindrales bacterium]|nr:glycosyltransferase family 4 protein [Candidatus Limnocylindrales bacterium]